MLNALLSQAVKVVKAAEERWRVKLLKVKIVKG